MEQHIKDKLAELNLIEAELRSKMEAEYMEFITPFEEEFENATRAQREKAMKLLDPVRTRIDKKILEWKYKLSRKIDAEMVKYDAAQKKAQVEFNRTTVAEKAIYDEQIRDRREQFENEWAKIAEENDAVIQKLYAE